MQSWDAKKPSEILTRTYILPKNLRKAGVTISACTIGQSVFEGTDPANPLDMLDGPLEINASPISYKGEAVSANQAVMQDIKAGLDACVYAFSIVMTLSTGEIFVEDCLQPVTAYVPSP